MAISHRNTKSIAAPMMAAPTSTMTASVIFIAPITRTGVSSITLGLVLPPLYELAYRAVH
jgi:hypothetical protein